MEMAMREEVLLENYLGLLNGLSLESKKKLVESLTIDIKNDIAAETDWIDGLYGSFVSNKPVEMMISEIRADRRFNHEMIKF